MAKKKQEFHYPIQTVYYRGKEPVRTNHAGSAFNAVPNCVSHMQVNNYEATVAEVFDLRDGTLHAVITRNVEGVIRIVFKREVQEGV